MIFATVGTHGQAFPRMLAGVEALPDPAEIVIQYGNGPAPVGFGHAAAFMPFSEMERHFEAADLVITHAGVGSILCARRAGHTPIVVPRYHELGEHVDDHQVELTGALAELGEVTPVWRDEELATVVAAAAARGEARPSGGDGALQRAVRSALLGAQ
ncbi:MAG: glycosyltransferase [Solirubrobacterales bacterium]